MPCFGSSSGIELMKAMTAKSVQIWNQKFPVGAPVKVYRRYQDETTAFEARTISPAFVAHEETTAVVVVDKDSGLHPLTHIEPLVSRGDVTGQANLQILKASVVSFLNDVTGVHGEGVAS